MNLWRDFSNVIVRKVLKMGKGAVIKVTNTDGTVSTLDMAELAAIDAIGAADLAKIDGITNGTGAAGKAVVLGATGGATIPGELALDGNTMAVEAGTGITAGTGTVYKSSVVKVGGIIKTSILIDLTGLASSTTDLDIIGVGAGAAYLGQITAARNGTILTGRMTCLELPVAGVTDIDLYSATEATGVFDAGIATLVETALLSSGAAWTNVLVRPLTAWPVANEHLYLTGGVGGVPGTYTAGKYLIELEGYDA